MKRLIFVFLLFLTATSSQAFASPPPPEPLFERLDLPTIKPEGAEDILSQVVEGQTPGGAYFKIVLPADWNGDLVIWNHGYSLDEPNADVDLGTLEDVQLAQGYAVAASSYRQSGWALFHTVEDLGELYQEFTARFGAPGQVYVYGYFSCSPQMSKTKFRKPKATSNCGRFESPIAGNRLKRLLEPPQI